MSNVSTWYAPLEGVFEHNGYLGLVYEIPSFVNLREFATSVKILPDSVIKDLLSGLVLAVNDAHKENIYLRQINPEMVFMEPETNRIVICELSSATYKTDLTRHLVRSCPGLIAPEVVQDKPYGAKADYFPIGVIGYIL